MNRFKNYIFLLIISLASGINAADDYRGFIEVDFDYSMGIEDQDSFRKLFIKPEGKKTYDFFKELYNRNKPSKREFSDTPTIPKIIHQVWVGGNELPPIYKYYQKSCQDLHPDWEYKLWTDKEVEEWDFENKDLYNETRNYAEKSDILRHQILKDFGGVYIDIDIKCVRPLDPMHYLYEAYFGLEFPGAEWGRAIIAPGIMASRAHHKIVTAVLKRIRQNWSNIDKAFDEGKLEIYDSRTFHSIGTMRSMRPVTDVFLEDVTLQDNVIALPATYFYPLVRLTGERVTDPLPMRFFRGTFDYFIKMVDPFATESMKTWLYDHYRQKDPFFVKGSRPESFSYHDYFEKNSTLIKIKFDNGFGLYDKRRKRIFKAMPPADKVKFNIFESFYEKNSPHGEVKFNHKNKINPKLHFINLDDLIPEVEHNNIESWRQLNPGMSAIIWHKDLIESRFPGLLVESNKITDLNDRKFYIALNILKIEGGVYINHENLKCLKNLFELNNKYDFYGGFLPFSTVNIELTIDRNFFASRASHWVVDRIIKDINSADGEPDVATIIKQDLYKYQALGGKNIMLPPIYFHPIDVNIGAQNIFDKIHQFYFDYRPAFSQVNAFNSFAQNND